MYVKPRRRAQPLNGMIQSINTVALTGGFDYTVPSTARVGILATGS